MSEPLAPSRAITGLVLLQALRVATDWLAAHRDEVNALNVFPVPDGDTGTNMLLTLREAVAAGAEAAREETAAGPIAMAIAGGALIGARGNSGVILCQMIRGFALAIADRDTISGPDIATALAAARDQAYAAVVEPVEGTMLTVVRGAAAAAAAITDVTSEPAPAEVLRAALAGARQALAQTPALLEVLRAANVVDAGGQGVVHVLDGLARYAANQDFATADADTRPGGDVDAGARMAAHGVETTGFCVNFLVWTAGPTDLSAVRERLGALGTSIDLVAADHALRVHVHTEQLGPVLDYGTTLGELDRIEIDNMGIQTRRLRHAPPPTTTPPAPQAPPTTGIAQGEVGVLAVAPSRGLAAALTAMGAAAVIGYEPAVNPSTADLLGGIAAIPTDQIVILPNNPNVQMAAQQAAKLADKAVAVVPSRSVPQGLAALSALSTERTLAENERRLTAALRAVRTVEVAHASRDAALNQIPVHAGEVIGFVDETLVATGTDLIAVTIAALTAADLLAAELVTVFTGAGLDAETASNLRQAIQAQAPDVTVEVVNGGQPYYPILAAVE